MQAKLFTQEPELLSPVVVIATIALAGVFVIGFVVQLIGILG